MKTPPLDKALISCCEERDTLRAELADVQSKAFVWLQEVGVQARRANAAERERDALAIQVSILTNERDDARAKQAGGVGC